MSDGDVRGLRFGAGVISVSLVLAAASCSSASRSPGGAQSPVSATESPVAASSVSPGAPVLTGTISVTGAHTITAGFTTGALLDVSGTQTPAPAGSTCAEYARGYRQSTQNGGGTGFDAPVLHTTGFENVYLRASIASGYAGAGTYASRRATSLTGEAVVGVGPEGSAVYEFYRSTHGTTMLTVKADGSGILEFSDWRTDEVRGGLPGTDITGRVSWVCR